MTAAEWWMVGGLIWLAAVGLMIAFLKGAHVDDEGEDR